MGCVSTRDVPPKQLLMTEPMIAAEIAEWSVLWRCFAWVWKVAELRVVASGERSSISLMLLEPTKILGKVTKRSPQL